MMQIHDVTPRQYPQFSWALQRLAAMQGTTIDPLLLHEAEKKMADATDPLQQLKSVSKVTGLPSPIFPTSPDQIDLPLLCYTPEYQWAVVISCTPQGQWVLIKEDGKFTLQKNQLIKKIAILRLNRSTSLYWSLLNKVNSKPIFFDHIRSSLFFYKKEIIEACIASGFISILALATSLFSMQVYDRVIPTRGDYTLIVLFTGVVLTILIELAMKFTRSHIMDHVVVGMDSRLSREICQRLLHLRLDHIPSAVGTLASQLRGYEQLRNFYTASTLFTLIDVPMAVCFLLIIMWIATPLVAFVPAISVLIIFLLGVSTRKKNQDYAKSGASLSNLKTGLLVEIVEGIETIKAGSGGWKFLSRWVDVNAATIQNDLKMRRTSEGVNYYVLAMQQLGYAALIAVGALVVMRGEMTMGALIACSIMSGRVLAPIMALPGLMIQHAHAQAALEGIEKIYRLKSDIDNSEKLLSPQNIKGFYRLENIQFAYANNPLSIAVPKLSIQPGERIAIVGPIGAGKSTLLRLLTGLYQPHEGVIYLDDLDISNIQKQVLNQNIGYLQQDHRLFQGTLRENLLIGLPDPGDEIILQAMRRTGMDQFVATHPLGLARQISEGGRGLSGGQKQLVAFTRLLLCNPQILLLDEPTATMDDEQERRCLHVLSQELVDQKTLVIVTHKSNMLALVSRILVVVGNRIVLDGPRDLVLQQLQGRQKASAPSDVGNSSEVSGTNHH